MTVKIEGRQGGAPRSCHPGGSDMHQLGQHSNDVAVARRMAVTAERLLLIAGMVSAMILIAAAF